MLRNGSAAGRHASLVAFPVAAAYPDAWRQAVDMRRAMRRPRRPDDSERHADLGDDIAEAMHRRCVTSMLRQASYFIHAAAAEMEPPISEKRPLRLAMPVPASDMLHGRRCRRAMRPVDRHGLSTRRRLCVLRLSDMAMARRCYRIMPASSSNIERHNDVRRRMIYATWPGK